MPYRRRLAVLAVALGALATAATAGAATTCHGLRVTTEAHGGRIVGTPQRDVILLTRPGIVSTGAGNDIVCGSSENDQISTGSGRDIILGGDGRDSISAGAGIDHIFGERGGDRIDSGSGHDVIVGGRGTDAIARQGGDSVYGGEVAVSITIPDIAVAPMLAEQMAIGMTVKTTGWILTAATTEPSPSPGFALQSYGAFYTGDSPMPYGVVQPQYPAQFSPPNAAWVVTQSGELLMNGLLMLPGKMTFENESPIPVTPGIAQWIAPFGEPTQLLPILVTPQMVFANETATINFTSTVAVYAASNIDNGSILPSLPGNAASVMLSSEHPTATFTWSTNTNSFVAGEFVAD